MNDKIGFIGVGSMGSALAGRFLGQRDLFVYDKYPHVADDLISRGAIFAELDEIATECAYVFTCLPAPTDMIDLFLGSGEFASKLQSGAAVIDMTTSTPLADERIAADLTGRSVSFADSPIAGGTRRVDAGMATLMVGADLDIYQSIEPLLHLITPDVIHVGGIGAGHTMKLVNNLLNACNRIAAMEAIRIGSASGISRATVLDVINRGSGRNYTTETTYPQLLSGDEVLPTNFALELYLKDARLANELAAAYEQDNKVGQLVERGLEDAVARYGGRTDISNFTADWYWNDTE